MLDKAIGTTSLSLPAVLPCEALLSSRLFLQLNKDGHFNTRHKITFFNKIPNPLQDSGWWPGSCDHGCLLRVSEAG